MEMIYCKADAEYVHMTVTMYQGRTGILSDLRESLLQCCHLKYTVVSRRQWLFLIF